MLTECDVLRCGMNASRKLRVDLHLAEILSLLDVCSAQAGAGGYPPVLSRQYIMRLFKKHLHITR